MKARIERWNITIIMLVIVYTVTVQRFILTNPIISPFIDSLVVFLTSIGVYRIIVYALHALSRVSPSLLQLYWGRQYLAGLWSYAYIRDGQVFLGVWRIEQDLYDTQIIGFGVDQAFATRSGVRSVTDLIHNNGAFEVVVLRTDKMEPDREYYSKTVLVPDRPTRKIWYLPACPCKIRGRTTIYGGPLTGTVHTGIVFTKHENAQTEEDVLQYLRSQERELGSV